MEALPHMARVLNSRYVNMVLFILKLLYALWKVYPLSQFAFCDFLP